jgi:hypothetical protein
MMHGETDPRAPMKFGSSRKKYKLKTSWQSNLCIALQTWHSDDYATPG